MIKKCFMIALKSFFVFKVVFFIFWCFVLPSDNLGLDDFLIGLFSSVPTFIGSAIFIIDPLLCLVALLTTVVVWIASAVFLVISFKKTWARTTFIILMTLTSLFDFAFSFYFSYFTVEWTPVLFTTLILVVGIANIILLFIPPEKKKKEEVSILEQ